MTKLTYTSCHGGENINDQTGINNLHNKFCFFPYFYFMLSVYFICLFVHTIKGYNKELLPNINTAKGVSKDMQYELKITQNL